MNTATKTKAGQMTGQDHIELVEQYAAHNYHPLPVVVSEAEGVWVIDVEGQKYMDMLAAYSAVNFGHCHPELVQAAKDQLDKVTLTSRAFHNDQLGPMCQALADLCGMEAVLPMNTGAEGVETADQLERLTELACDEAQGDLISPPLPADAFQVLFASQPLSIVARG